MNHREALFYEKKKSGAVKCSLCALRCTIREGKRGVCRVRINRNGKLYTLTYGMLSSKSPDPIEKKPLFHFYPGSFSFSIATAGCNLSCPWCQNHDLSQSVRRGVEPNQIGVWTPPENIVKYALKTNCSSISYTYSEPTIFYEYARDIAVMAKKAGLRNVFVTNGMMTPEVVKDMANFLDAANVDIKSGSREFYKKFCKGSLEGVFESTKTMWNLGIWVEVTTLLIPGFNDSDRDIEAICEFILSVSKDIPWHISRFHPDNEWLSVQPTPVSSLQRAAYIGQKSGIRYIYIGNVMAPGFEDTKCPNCGEILIHRIGFSSAVTGMKEGKCKKCLTEIAGRWQF